MSRSKTKRKKKSIAKQAVYNVDAASEKLCLRLDKLCARARTPLYRLLTKEDKFGIHYLCFSTTNIHIHPNSDPVDKDMLKYLDRNLRWCLDTVKVTGSHRSITISDGFILNAVKTLIENVKKETDKNYYPLLVAYKVLDDYYRNNNEQAVLQMVSSFLMLTGSVTRVTKSLCYAYIDRDKNAYKAREECGAKFLAEIEIQKHVPEYITIDHHSRPIFPLTVNVTNGDRHPVEIDSSKVKDLYHGKLEKLPVFIQSHAYKRLLDRELPKNEIQVNIAFYISTIKGFKTVIFQNKLLLEHNGLEGKRGYFLSIIQNDKIIIKTYLPITHTSTPEGEKFRRLTGMSKLDLEYWDIDKLSTFVDNDMTEDNDLYPYFEKAGLLHLFEIQPESCSAHDDHMHTVNWDVIDAYIKQNSDTVELSDAEQEAINTENSFDR